MIPEYLHLLDTDTTLFSQAGLTIEQWVNLYVESGQAATDYDYLLEMQRKAWLSELQALDIRQRIRDESVAATNVNIFRG